MGKEIEHKFLVKKTDFLKNRSGTSIVQSYISLHKGGNVRIRIAGNKGFLTIKSKTVGIVRTEFEYQIPLADAQEMIKRFCEKPTIKKVRYLYRYKGYKWEIDVFKGKNKGLIIAEIELDDENQKFPLPAWLGKKVTGEKRYYNRSLIRNPYKNWKQ